MKCRLKEILDERGMKQKFLAEKAGVSIGTMSAIVRGKTTPSLSVAFDVAEALDMRIEDIWRKD
jgi:putative transcriptional regulator